MYPSLFIHSLAEEQASLVAQLVKNLPEMQIEPGFDPWVGKIPWRIPWRRGRLPTPIFWPGEFHGLFHPWGLKELDTTEWLSLSHSLYWRAPWTLPSLGNSKRSCYKHLYAGFCVNVSFHLLWKKPPNCLPKWLYHFAVPSAVNKLPYCSTSSPAFGVVSVLDFGHSNRHVKMFWPF